MEISDVHRQSVDLLSTCYLQGICDVDTCDVVLTTRRSHQTPATVKCHANERISWHQCTCRAAAVMRRCIR